MSKKCYKALILFILLIGVVSVVASEDYNTYNLELLKQFTFGMELDQYGFNNQGTQDSFGPSSIAFDNSGNLFVVDNWKGRIVKYDSQIIQKAYIKLDRWFSSVNFQIAAKTVSTDHFIGYSSRKKKINKFRG